MRKTLALFLSATAFAVAGCQTTPSSPRGPAPSADVFRPADFAWSMAPGANRLDGRLAYRQGSATYTCSNVALMPETPYTARRMQILYLSTTGAAAPAPEVQARTAPPAPDEFNSYVRSSRCDEQGRFSFNNLPDGAWFAITRARPASATGEQIAIMKRVVTRGGRVTQIDL